MTVIRHCSQTGRVSMTIRLANVEDAAALDEGYVDEISMGLLLPSEAP